MDLEIYGKTALVTASGRGLGKSIAHCLAREGVRLVINSRTAADLEALIENLPQMGQPHLKHCLDLSKKEGPVQLLEFLSQENVFPDIVVHNLGGNLGVTDPFCSLEEWQAVMRVNLEVPIELNRALIPYMQKKGWGRVCHVSSIAGLENQGPPSYCAAKAGMIAYTRSLGRFVAKDGVVINAILPGAVMTEGGYWDHASKNQPGHIEKYLTERMAIQRFGKPDEIGKVVAFMCSQHASFCIGSAFLVDGGQGRMFYAQT